MAVDFRDRVLDRRAPSDFEHVTLYPGSAIRRLATAIPSVELALKLPASHYVAFYDQGREGACVGHGESIAMSLINRRLYDAFWLYREAQLVDEWDDTPPAEGTSLRAGFDILRDVGHRRIYAGTSKPPKVEEGIVDVNRWLTTVDEMRTAIAAKMPVVLGINWYDKFYVPSEKGREKWIADTKAWGRVAGGHCICCIGASDRRQAFLLLNSWGRLYGTQGRVWLPYDSMTRLLAEQGEAAVVTDR